VSILGNAGLSLMELRRSRQREALSRTSKPRRCEPPISRKQLLAYSGKGKFLVQFTQSFTSRRGDGRTCSSSRFQKAVFRTRLAADLPVIEADAAQIQQVVMNRSPTHQKPLAITSVTLS